MYRLIRDCVSSPKTSYQPARESLLTDWQHLEIENSQRISGIFNIKAQNIQLPPTNDAHIGQGEFTNVYQVMVKLDGQPEPIGAALKKFRWQENDNRFRKMAHEARTLLQLQNHENIIQILGACYQNSHFGLLLELCEGGSLGSLTRGYPSRMTFSLSILVDWAKQIALGMKFLIAHGYLHNDLRADNILVKEPICFCAISQVTSLDRCSNCSKRPLNKMSLKIIGFGSASDTETVSNKEKTPWNAPDQKSSEFSEVWSYGVVLWEMTSRLIPDLGLREPLLIHENWPESWKHLIKQCWKKELIDRPSFAEIVEYLKSMKGSNIEVNSLVARPKSQLLDMDQEVLEFESNVIRLPGKSESLDDCFLRNGKFGNFYEIRVNSPRNGCCKCIGNLKIREKKLKSAMLKTMMDSRDYRYRQLIINAQKLSQLSHPNLLKLLAVCQEDKYFGWIFELFQAESLRKIVKVKRDLDDKIHYKIIVDWTVQITSVIIYLQEKGLELWDLNADSVLIKQPICYCSDSEISELEECSKCKKRPINKLTLKICDFNFEEGAVQGSNTKNLGNLLWEITMRRAPNEKEHLEIRNEWTPSWKNIVKSCWTESVNFTDIMTQLEDYSSLIASNRDEWDVVL